MRFSISKLEELSHHYSRFEMSPPPSSSRQRMKKSKQTEENYRKHRNPVSQSNSNSISGQKQLSVHFGPSQTHPSPSRSPSSNRRFGSSPNLRPRVSKSRQLNSYENQQHQQQHQQQQAQQPRRAIMSPKHRERKSCFTNVSKN